VPWLTQAGGGLAVARSEGGVHPVFGLWSIALAPGRRADLEAGKRKVLDWTREHGAMEVAFAPVTIGGRNVYPVLNINRAEDLATAEALLENSQF
jgi:molybdenum cofactor guanylyltransferase